MHFLTLLKIAEIVSYFLVTIDLYGKERLKLLEQKLGAWKRKRKDYRSFQNTGWALIYIAWASWMPYLFFKFYKSWSGSLFTSIQNFIWHNWLALGGWLLFVIVMYPFGYFLVVSLSALIYYIEKVITEFLEMTIAGIIKAHFPGVMILTGTVIFVAVKIAEICLIQNT